MTPAAKVALAVAALRAGRALQAEALCLDAIRENAEQADALQVLAVLALQRGDREAGIGLLRRSLKVNPNNALAHCNLGNALLEAKQPADALDGYRRAVALMPNFAGAYYGQGNALMELQHFADAVASFDRALALQPNYAEAYNNRGNALRAIGEVHAALDSYRRAVDQQPRFSLAIGNCAKILLESGRYDESLACYDRRVQLPPPDARAFRDRGHCLMKLDRTADAVWSFDRSLSIDPNDAETWYARGTAHRQAKRHAQALEDFERAHALAPDSVDVIFRKAEALRDLQRPTEAGAAFAQVLHMAPDRDFALGNLLQARLQVCDWSQYEELVEQAVQAVTAGRPVCLPGPFMSVSPSAVSQRQCAEIFVSRKKNLQRNPLWTGERYSHDKIRVAYVSADFREHPVSVLLAGLLEHHDRRRFVVTGISLASEQATQLGQRVKNAFDQFIDVAHIADQEVAALLRANEIDIAVDLMGLTGGGRPGIFSHRAAPIHVNYLGYTGTTASPDMDYIIADSTVIPREEQFLYTEKVVYMPDSYQPADDQRSIAARTPPRAHVGLPERGFVFCCFNTHYKISPQFFAIWMQLLMAVPGSVLWLSAASREAVDNLRRAALARGVAPERLVFAARLDNPADHLARYRLADLFLDTLPFNAHATASDALWAGVPVLTCRGGTFAGRVAASLLTAVALPELIATSLDDYAALALALATSKSQLPDLRARLQSSRNQQALFNTQRYCRHLETAYATMWQRRQHDEAPAAFTVSAN